MRMPFLSRIAPVVVMAWIAATGCSGPSELPESPRDTEFARLESSGHGAFARGEFEYARTLFERQLLQAERSDRPLNIGDSAYNLAVCEIALGNGDRARKLLDTALFELQRAGEPLAAVHVVRARLEHQAGDSDACLAAADLALVDASGASRRERIEALALRGLALLSDAAGGNSDPRMASGAALKRAQKLSKKLGRAYPMPAAVLRLRARLAQHDGDFVAAAEAFEREAESSQTHSRYDFMSQALELAGDAWMAAGDRVRAGDRWLRAARSRFAHAVGREMPAARAIGDLGAAARLCDRVSESGAPDTDPSLLPRLERLLARIDRERERVQGVLDRIDAGAALGAFE